MVSRGTNDQTGVTYPILSEVESRFVGKLSALCYPMGLAAYYADQILYYSAEPNELVEELRQGLIRRGEDQQPVKFPQPLDVAVDALISNDFYMLLTMELKDSQIYDADTFFEFMQQNSPEANQLGVIGNNPRGRFKPARNLIPREIKM